MTTTNVTLTSEELNMIEARRAKENEAAEQKEKEDAARNERIRKQEEIRLSQITTLKDALLSADTDGIIADTDKGLVFFLGGVGIVIDIDEHRVFSRNFRMGGHSKGMKYHIRSNYWLGFRDSWYTNPNTLIKKIVEQQSIVQAVENRKKAAKSLSEQALAEMTEKYPNAKVTFEKGYEYGVHQNRRYAPDRIVVTTDNGSVEFSFYRKGDAIQFSVFKREIKIQISDAVNALILG